MYTSHRLSSGHINDDATRHIRGANFRGTLIHFFFSVSSTHCVIWREKEKALQHRSTTIQTMRRRAEIVPPGNNAATTAPVTNARSLAHRRHSGICIVERARALALLRLEPFAPRERTKSSDNREWRTRGIHTHTHGWPTAFVSYKRERACYTDEH